jgi:DMSO/TMAO reductase YedYZ molybdopterin-dependent catalytic subunit
MKARILVLAAIALGLHLDVSLGQVAPGSEQKDLTVIGLDSKEVRLSVADLDKLPQEKAVVKNEDESTTTYSGVKLQSILDKVGVPAKKALRGDALQQLVVVSARDGYSVPFTVGELDPTFGDLKVLLVYRKDGKALPDYQGPFRLLIPTDKAGARSVRMVQAIRVTSLAAGKDGKGK